MFNKAKEVKPKFSDNLNRENIKDLLRSNQLGDKRRKVRDKSPYPGVQKPIAKKPKLVPTKEKPKLEEPVIEKPKTEELDIRISKQSNKEEDEEE